MLVIKRRNPHSADGQRGNDVKLRQLCDEHMYSIHVNVVLIVHLVYLCDCRTGQSSRTSYVVACR